MKNYLDIKINYLDNKNELFKYIKLLNKLSEYIKKYI